MNLNELRQRAAAVELAVFDIDGVMTDGRLYFTDSGEQIKAFHVRDGLGLKALMQHGVIVAVITARNSALVHRRMRELGIERVMQGHEDKSAALDQLLADTAISADRTCYTGDDLVDWPAMRRCGLKCAPADADPWICRQVDHLARRGGGRGAVREICELILEARGELAEWRDRYR